ncbi:ester cyclase [Paenibacillus sp. GCM10023248]|uniref:ester cyclase n=1 Tax=Bacillales TaxID=1385 RepID=UPI002379D633|nr:MULTISPECIES: ester cyclase [Bacillales]MDD9265783.1 ester cyclase [Paenibacillus sp. MAHUQ-63]MDR6879024.1 putative ester cyclase [Bacillus sp. 3255]
MHTKEQKNAETVTSFIEDTANWRFLEKTDQFFLPQFMDAFTNRYFTVDDTIAQGDKVIARVLVTAVHSGHFAGHAPTGNTIKATQFHEFHVIDGVIQEHRGWLDTSTLLPQIKTP